MFLLQIRNAAYSGEHKKVFAYEAHTACDKHNFILGVHVTPGNIHDSVA
ncbi:transposase, partial [Butyricicoccus sp. OF27-2pH9A]